MEKITTAGKYIFALAIFGLALVSLITSSLPVALVPLSKAMGGNVWLARAFGIILLLASFGVVLNKMALAFAYAIATLFLVICLFVHLPLLISNIYNPNEWVAFTEILCFTCGGILLAATVNKQSKNANKANWVIKTATVAKYIFAIAISVFGIQHIMYEKFIISLIPAWVPLKQFWAYMVEAAFILTPISIIINIKTKLSTFLLGLMFLIWVAILHSPRAINAATIEAEWTSLFVALGMAGVCFILSKKGVHQIKQSS
jgi:hypothetical protein